MNYLKKSLRCLFFILPFFAVSCISPLDQTDIYNQTKSEKTVLVTGSIAPELQGAFPKEIIDGLINNENGSEKTAYPTPTVGTSFLYQIRAIKVKTDGTLDETDFNNFNLETTSYAIRLQQGKWKLRACVYYSTDTNYANPIMQGEAPTPIEIKEDTPGTIVAEQIVVQPVMTSGGFGSIELKWWADNSSYSTDSEKIIKLKFKSIDGTIEETTSNIDTTENNTKISVSSIASGSYILELNFYNSSNNLLYQCYETVNVYNNLKTNTWCGNADYFYEEEGTTKFKITKQCREKFTKSIIYVNQDAIVDDLASGYSDEGNGSISSPYNSLKSAINKINSQSKGTYTIFINGDIKLLRTSNSDYGLYYSEITNNSDITIIGTDTNWVPLTGSNKIEISVYQDTSTKYADDESPNMGFIKTDGNLTLKNIKFYNFGSKTNQNNAIWLNGDENNKKTFNALYCEFVNCKSYHNQLGAISSSYFNNIIDKCIFDSCKAIITGTPAWSMGGAINLDESNCKIKDTIFKNCSAKTGAAIYASGSSENYLEISGNCVFGDESILPLDNVPSTSGNTASEGIVYVNDMNCTITGNVKFIGNYITQSSVLYIRNTSTTSNIVNIGNQGANNNSSPIFQYNKVDQTSESESFNAGIITVEGKCNFNFYSGEILNNNIKISTNFNKKAATALHESDNTSANDLNYYGGIIKDNIISNESYSIFDTTLITAGILNSNKGSTLKLGNVILQGNKYSGGVNISNCDIAIDKDNSLTNMAFIKDYKGSEKINIVVKKTDTSNYVYDTSNFITVSGSSTTEQISRNKNNIVYLETPINGFYVNYTEGKIEGRKISQTEYDIANAINYNSLSSKTTVYVYDQKGLETISNIIKASTTSNITNFSGKTIVLNNDIVVTNLETIGEASTLTAVNSKFMGTFNGNDKKITIKSIKNGTKSLFSNTAYSDTINNLTIDGDITVSDDFYPFAIWGGSFYNCTNNCNITCTNSGKTITGFCKLIQVANKGFENCKNTGNLNAPGGTACGFTCDTDGASYVYYKNCSNEGNITGKNVAGLAGKIYGLMVNCSNKGNISGECVGGIAIMFAGYNKEQIPTPDNSYDGVGIFNCYNNGEITCTNNSTSCYAGGIVGSTNISVSPSANFYVTIQNCVNYKKVKGDASYIGGIIGYATNSTNYHYDLFKYNYYNNLQTRVIGNYSDIFPTAQEYEKNFYFITPGDGNISYPVFGGTNYFTDNYYTAVDNWITKFVGATDYSFYKQWVAENVNQKIPYIFEGQ